MVFGQIPVLVRVIGYYYAVDLGPGVSPREHRVAINGECTCSLGRDCPAVSSVLEYLRDGGERAQRPPLGYYPVHPAKCPVCKSATVYAPDLSSPKRGAGWVCIDGGKSHYWQHFAWVGMMKSRLAKKGIRA